MAFAELDNLCRQVRNGTTPGAWKKAADWLIDEWLADYKPPPHTHAEIVETSSANFSYLFDIAASRLIAAYGVSHGKHTGKRDSSRMAGSPLGGPKGYHRGHAIPHTLGGPLDINLVPQLGSVNIGPFRALERQAVATPGAFYFTYWKYPPSAEQRPSGVVQGLLIAGGKSQIVRHGN